MKKPLPLFIVGILLTLGVALNIYWWIVDSAAHSSFEDAKQQWLTRFTPVIQSARLITGLNILCLALAIVIFSLCKRHKHYKIVCLALIGIDCLLLLWQLFSLM